MVYKPNSPIDNYLSKHAGLDVGGFPMFTVSAKGVRTKKQPLFDVNKSIAVSLCAIRYWR